MLYKSQVHPTNLKVKLNLFLDSQVHPPNSIVNFTFLTLVNKQVHPPYSIVNPSTQQLSTLFLLNSQVHAPFSIIYPLSLLNSQVHPTYSIVKLLILTQQSNPHLLIPNSSSLPSLLNNQPPPLFTQQLCHLTLLNSQVHTPNSIVKSITITLKSGPQFFMLNSSP